MVGCRVQGLPCGFPGRCVGISHESGSDDSAFWHSLPKSAISDMSWIAPTTLVSCFFALILMIDLSEIVLRGGFVLVSAVSGAVC